MPRRETHRFAPAASRSAYWGRVGLVAVCYLAVLWIGTWLGFSVQVGEERITVLWLPTGVTFGALLLTRRVWWPALLIGSAAVYVAYGLVAQPQGFGLGEYVFNAAVADVVMWLGAEVFWLGRGRAVRLERPGDIAWLFAVVLAVTAIGAVASVALWWTSDGSLDFWHEVQLWWFADALGCVVAVPWMLAAFAVGPREKKLSRFQQKEVVLLFVVLVAVCVVMVRLPYRTQSVLELPYLVYPVLIWGAVRFGPRITSTLLLVLGVLFVLDMYAGVGPFAANGLNNGGSASYHVATLAVQVYLLVTCLVVLILSAVVGMRRGVEAQLTERNRNLEVMGQTLRTTLWVMDARTTKLLYLSQAFERLTGREPGTMLGRVGAWDEIVHPDDRGVTRASLKVMQDRGWDDTEYRVVRGEGEDRWVRELSAAVTDDDGNIRQIVGSVEDVTHRHRAAEQRRQLLDEIEASNDRYRDFMRITGEAVWRAEFDFPVKLDQPYDGFEDDACNSAWIAECNKRFAEMFGVDDPEKIVGRRVTDFFPLRDRSNTVYHEFYEQHCRSITAEVCDHRDPANPRWYLVSFAGVVEDGHLVRIWGTRTETTEQRRLEAQLRESQKMEAVGQLAGGVAHDFNNLLAVISAHAELMQDQLGEDERVEKSLRVVREAIDHAAGVSRSLLAFSKNLPSDKRPTDLRHVIAQTQRLVERTLPSTIELNIELPAEGLAPVLGDAVQLQQVLLNLAINARDAMPAAGGTITVAAEDFEKRTTAGGSAGRWVRLVVSDDGAGMSEQVRQRIFEPFFSTKGPDAGTGLGLSVVRGIVEEHGGAIAVFSRHQQGTTFTIELPCVEEPLAVPTKNDAPGPSVYESGVSAADRPVLLGEDDAQIRAVIASALVSRGYRVVQAGDGTALRQAYDEQVKTGQDFAALVTDVDMPGRTGLDVLRELRREGCATPAVVITGSVELKLDPRIDGNTVLINKPFSVADLFRTVQQQIAGDTAGKGRG